MTKSESHIPVLKREVLAALKVFNGGVYIDATLGRAGHACAIADQMGASGRLVALDRDPHAVQLSQPLFKEDHRVQLIHGEFSRLSELIHRFTEIREVDGILMDLGVSSPQLDQAERGFSFMREGDLDMRMDPTQGESAEQWLSRVEESELVQVLFEFGEEKFARRIARAIIVHREQSKIVSTVQLASIIEQSIPRREKHKHPATRTFQAIRLQVNQELNQLTEGLPQAVSLLRAGGRLAVISFHSLEDRIVKRFFRSMATPTLPPRNIPVAEEAYRTPLRILGKAVKPRRSEIAENPRSRSAVLRVVERTDVPLPENIASGGRNAR